MTGLASRTALTAPKEGADVRVGRELGDELGWMMRRTKRAEELIALPEVMAMADELARHMERYATTEQVAVRDLQPTIIPTQTKSYITINFGAHDCASCATTGYVAGHLLCDVCGGAGFK